MIMKHCRASELKTQKPLSECTKEERQYICQMLREFLEHTDKLKVDFMPAVRCVAKSVAAVGVSAVSLLISFALFGKMGLFADALSGSSPEEKSIFDSAEKDGNLFLNQQYTESYMKSLDKAEKLKRSIQIFADKARIDLSQVMNNLDTFIAQYQDFTYSDKRQVRDNRDILSQVFVDNNSVFDAVRNTEGSVSKMVRKVLR